MVHWSLTHYTHLYTEASELGCLDSPSPVNWSWCWCGYSGCWVAGQAWSCHSCSEISEMADSGWVGVRNASNERQKLWDTLIFLHALGNKITSILSKSDCAGYVEKGIWVHLPEDFVFVGSVILESHASLHGGNLLVRLHLWMRQLLSHLQTHHLSKEEILWGIPQSFFFHCSLAQSPLITHGIIFLHRHYSNQNDWNKNQR